LQAVVAVVILIVAAVVEQADIEQILEHPVDEPRLHQHYLSF
jgi:hypothetical protein